MYDNTYINIILGVCALVSLYKFFRRAGDSLYGFNSPSGGEFDLDGFGLLLKGGMIVLLLWIFCGGLTSFFGLPASTFAHHGSSHWITFGRGVSGSSFVSPSRFCGRH